MSTKLRPVQTAIKASLLFCLAAYGQTPKETPSLPPQGTVISTITLEAFQQIVQAMGFEDQR